ncbi:MAG: trypsin-like peptidase domain-containing protein [Elusimicrobia bacterium]|nr:trypsin-like peptidase domain-containing protein [Elusimicrobiota bacterium]
MTLSFSFLGRLKTAALSLAVCIFFEIGNRIDSHASPIGNIRKAVVPLEVRTRKNIPTIATGFFVEKSSGNYVHVFLATARHVVETDDPINDYGVELTVFANRNLNDLDATRGQPRVVSYQIPLATSAPRNVVFPSDPSIDVAVIYLNTKNIKDRAQIVAQAEAYSLGKSTEPQIWRDTVNIPLPDMLDEPAGDESQLKEIVFMGFPFGTNKVDWLHPIARSGVIASPTTKGYVQHNYGPSAFLIDNGPMPGDSGGPIFSRHTTYGLGIVSVEMRLLGIISREVPWEQIIDNRASRYHPKFEIERTKLNLGVGYPAKFILEAIDTFLAENIIQE